MWVGCAGGHYDGRVFGASRGQHAQGWWRIPEPRRHCVRIVVLLAGLRYVVGLSAGCVPVSKNIIKKAVRIHVVVFFFLRLRFSVSAWLMIF